LRHGVKTPLNRVNAAKGAFAIPIKGESARQHVHLTVSGGASMVPAMTTANNLFFGICREIIRT
jgi:hypothetical protein